MAQRLAFIVLTLAVAFPGSALALGLGEITLESALNQRMDARIELTSASQQELDGLEVSLASAETFERYGLDRSSVAGRLAFSVERDERGRAYIQVSSPDAIREPFVSFLLEARWPSGRLMREYTVLLDPPTFMEDGAAEAGPTRPAREPSTTAPSTRAEPSGDRVRVPDEAAPRTSPRQTARSAPVGPGGTYGPVQRNQTLWGIATELRPDRSITINQMMMALFRANPEAFQGNINRLKQGYSLQVPELDRIRAMSQREATAAVRDHNRRWRGEAGPAVADSGDDAGGESARLSLVAPEGAGSAGAGGGEPDPELQAEVERLRAELREAEATSGELSEEVVNLRQDVDEAERLLQVKDSQLADLQQQLRERGVEVDTVPEEPFEAFSEDRAPAEEDAAAPETTDTGEVAAEETGETGPAPGETPDPTTEGEPATDEAAQADAEPETATETGTETATEAGDAAAGDAAEAEEPAERPTSAPAVQRPEPSLMDTVLDTLTRPMVLAGVLGVLVLLIVGFLGLRAVRARRERAGAAASTPDWAAESDAGEAEMPTEIAEVPGAEEVAAGEAPAGSSSKSAGYAETQRLDEDEVEQAAQDVSEDAEKTAILDRPQPQQAEEDVDPFAETMAGGQPINLDESDPTSEADFHMAYGLYDQAADMMVKAVEQHPDRKDFKVKLLEVYFVWGNKDEFLKQANAFQEELAGTSDWDNVVIMGKQIAPDEELFSSAAVGGGESAVDLDFGGEEASGESAAASDLDIFGDDTDTGGGEEAPAPASETASEPAGDDSGDLEFDLSDLGGGEEPAPSEAPASPEAPAAESADAGDDDMGLDIDLGLDESAGAEPAGAEASGGTDSGEDDATLKLSEEELGQALDQSGSEAESASTEEPASGGGDEEMEFDLSDFETPDSSEAGAAQAGAAEEGAASASSEDELSFDLDTLDTGDSDETPTQEAGQESSQESSQDAGTEDEGEDSQNEFDKALGELSAFVDTNVEDEEEASKGGEDDNIFGDHAAEESVGEMDFSLDEDTGGEASISDASWSSGETEADAASSSSGNGEDEEWDDIGTKLDLARAYIDMGDPDGARNILEEVVSEGDEQQRKDAEELLGQVS